MAEANKDLLDDIIIINDAEAAGVELNETETVEKVIDTAKLKKRLFLLLGIIVVVILLALIVTLFTKNAPDKISTPPDDAFTTLQNDLNKEPQQPVSASKLEKMITKANYLYANGNHTDALKIYERIALYSEAISHYNLGVAQLKEGEYPTALNSFKSAIAKGEHRCVSAINAAVCALNLKDSETFRYYIDMAYAYLPYESKSPLYNYYYALIHYYKGDYLEAYAALEHPSSGEYPIEQRELKARIAALIGNYYEAIGALEEPPLYEKDSGTLGLLYANIGDLTLAKEHLHTSLLQSNSGMKEQLALALVQLKSGQLDEGGKSIRTLSDMYPNEVTKPYPISVSLLQRLFDPDAAQNYYRHTLQKSRTIDYHKIFYFAPYKVFNAEQTISYIRKGNANIYIDDIASAKEYLKKSATGSGINYGIAKAIQKALSFRLNEANEALLALQKEHPKHSILNYNLGLTFAQSGDFINAYNYFLQSYYLDANNYMSGIFALMCSQLTGETNLKVRAIIKENLSHEDDSEPFELYRTLMEYTQDNYVGTLPWLEKQYKERPLYLMLNILIASRVDRNERAKNDANKLALLQPHDILPHLVYIDTHFDHLKNRAYAKALISYFAQQKFSFEDLYYGPYITRYLYAQSALITGQLYPLRQQLEAKIETSTENLKSIIQALALVNVYEQRFEAAYINYNQLIDEYAVRDPMTLFMGAIASIGADHHANGIALLELAKLKNPNFMESRYALGLLYLESNNYQGASIQFQHIGNSGFSSNYFNFGINTEKLLFEKREAAKAASAS